MSREIFISYSTEDRAVADDLCGALESAGLTCWIAPRNIEPGSSWTASIMKAIAECRVMVLIFSSKSNESSHVVREILHAVEKRRQVFPIRIEDVTPTEGLGYCLVGVQWFDATTPPLNQHVGSLVKQIQQVLQNCGGKATAPALPAGPPDTDAASDIFFECPCGQHLVVDASAAGQSFPCPTCQQTVNVPTPEGYVAEKAKPAKEKVAPAVSATFDPAVIVDLKAALATYLGPVSKVLVDRAAARSGSVAELVEQLATDIDSPEDRESFLQSTKKARRG